MFAELVLQFYVICSTIQDRHLDMETISLFHHLSKIVDLINFYDSIHQQRHILFFYAVGDQ